MIAWWRCHKDSLGCECNHMSSDHCVKAQELQKIDAPVNYNGLLNCFHTHSSMPRKAAAWRPVRCVLPSGASICSGGTSTINQETIVNHRMNAVAGR